MTISEKSAYLKGLMDGLNLDTEAAEGKMIAAIVDLLMKNGHVVSEIKKNKIGLEEYYIELMSKKEAE